MARMFVRFSRIDRIEHLAIVVLFLVLVLTGLPQRFYDHEFSQSVISMLGGIDHAQLIHRMAGVLLVVATAFHIIYRSVALMRNPNAPSMIINKQDFLNSIINLRYYVGLTQHEARSDRFDYKQKFEYWGLLFGTFIMIGSGLLLYFPVFFTKFLPGQVIAAAKVAHSNEAMLALLVVVIWHMYDCIFSPEVFPLDTSIFTGKISEERMKKEHPLEYERLITQDKSGVHVSSHEILRTYSPPRR